MAVVWRFKGKVDKAPQNATHINLNKAGDYDH